MSEQLRICWCRIWRRRWLWLAITWATCALGGTALFVLAPRQATVTTGLLLGLVLLAGATTGGLAAALVAGRDPVFDSVAELRGSFRLPVLGSVADMAAGPWSRAKLDLRFAVACLGLITVLAGLIASHAMGWLAER